MIFYRVSCFLALTALLCLPVAAQRPPGPVSYELTPEQVARLKRYMPKTLAKLQKKAPVNVVSVGDSVMGYYIHSDDTGNMLKSYAGVFVQMLADQFYYPGGLRILKPGKGLPDKLYEVAGPEVILNDVSRGGKTMENALQALSTIGMQTNPDLALLSFGINDSIYEEDFTAYRTALERVIKFTKANNVELMLFGPTLTMAGPPEKGLAQTRPYADVMQEVAEANGIFYADLGDLAWMVRLDDRSVTLRPVPPKPVAIDPNTKQPVPQPPMRTSPVQIPLTDDADPDPEKKAARFFNQVAEGYRRYIDWGNEMNDPLHPGPELHRILGRRLFHELLNGPKTVPWNLDGASAEMQGDDKCEVIYHIENPTNKPFRAYMLPLVTLDWKPIEAQSYIDLRPGKRAPLSITYEREKTSARANTETVLRFPMLVMGSTEARIETLRAAVGPIAVAWNTATQFNQDGGFHLEGQLYNGTKDDQNGKWEASWMGQSQSGTIHLPARNAAKLKLEFKLPPDDEPINRERGHLSFAITAGGQTYHYNGEIDAVRNIGLKQALTTWKRDLEVLDKPMVPASLPDATHPGVTFRVDADPGALYLTWDIVGINLIDNVAGACQAEINIDARSYGKRLTPGSTDVIRVWSPAADGDGNVGVLFPWMFGDGYDRGIERSDVKVHLSSRSDGSRRFTVMIPRNTFYLHEWALGNGNSELGLRTTFILRRPVAPDVPGDVGMDAYVLDHCQLPRDNALSDLAVELTDKPTRRWTVRFY